MSDVRWWKMGYGSILLAFVLCWDYTGGGAQEIKDFRVHERSRPHIGAPAAKVRVERVDSGVSNEVSDGFWIKDPEVSWYGPGFYGNRTACGKAYTKQILGVAHRTLPCGTKVAFRWHGKVAIVPVIDRGPYVSGRQWDLSGGLCVYLDHCFTGPIEYRIMRK